MKFLFEAFNLIKKPQTIAYSADEGVRPSARGIPVPIAAGAKSTPCESCRICEKNCPTAAIQILSAHSIQFDYGQCLQCGLCTQVCPDQLLVNSNFVHVFSVDRQDLQVSFDQGEIQAVDRMAQEPLGLTEFRALTRRRGFNYREVAAAGNNATECELNASFNATFDSESEGVRCVASPKHADALVFSGPVSQAMTDPLQIAWDCMPEPKALIACGTEAISGGLFSQGRRPQTPHLFIAGDPPRPDVAIAAFRYLMGRSDFSFRKYLSRRLKALRS